ncbi:MAG: hypothetical protein V3V21_09210 [Thermoplasmata archaeon]
MSGGTIPSGAGAPPSRQNDFIRPRVFLVVRPRHYLRIATLVVLLGLALFIITVPMFDPYECGKRQDPFSPGIILFASFCVAALVFIGIAYRKGHTDLDSLLGTVLVTLFLFFLTWFFYVSLVPTC